MGNLRFHFDKVVLEYYLKVVHYFVILFLYSRKLIQIYHFIVIVFYEND